VPKDARTMTPTLEAYTSIAGCIVRERTRGMELRPNRNAVNDLELAIHPAIDLLDTVIEVGDPVHQIIALHAKADIYHGLTVMLDDTLRRSPGFGRSRDVERLTQEWRNNARDANRKVIAIAERDPYLVRRNPVLVAVVRDSRTDHAPGIATR
jgi:hypothetical protein